MSVDIEKLHCREWQRRTTKEILILTNFIQSLVSLSTDCIHVHSSKTTRGNYKPGTNYLCNIPSAPRKLLQLAQVVE